MKNGEIVLIAGRRASLVLKTNYDEVGECEHWRVLFEDSQAEEIHFVCRHQLVAKDLTCQTTQTGAEFVRNGETQQQHKRKQQEDGQMSEEQQDVKIGLETEDAVAVPSVVEPPKTTEKPKVAKPSRVAAIAARAKASVKAPAKAEAKSKPAPKTKAAKAPAKEKAEKPKTTPKPKKEPAEGDRRRMNVEATVKVLCKENPKREGSVAHSVFAILMKKSEAGKTVGDIVEAIDAKHEGRGRPEIFYCVDKGFIKLVD